MFRGGLSMVLATKKDVVILDSQFKNKGNYTAEVTELTMSEASTLANIIDANQSIALVIRLRYKTNDIRQGYVAIKGYKRLFNIVKNVKVVRSNTIYVVESSRKNDVNV